MKAAARCVVRLVDVVAGLAVGMMEVVMVTVDGGCPVRR